MAGSLLLRALALLFLAWPMLAAGATDSVVPTGPTSEAECVDCHSGRDPELLRQWRDGPHRSIACSACHGDRHTVDSVGAAQRARPDGACTSCHAGAAHHSYSTSKHGVLTALEQRRHGWARPFRRGNYRSPGCGYCHLHAADHGDTMNPSRGPAVDQWVCAGCHSPRYVREQMAVGQRLVAIADIKRREGDALLAQSTGLNQGALAELRQNLARHLRNVRLGAGHQSPDYQWWHGQPALDGDLIRIREAVATRRLETGSRKADTGSPDE